MGAGFDAEYQPSADNAAKYALLFEKYERFGKFIENQTE